MPGGEGVYEPVWLSWVGPNECLGTGVAVTWLCDSGLLRAGSAHLHSTEQGPRKTSASAEDIGDRQPISQACGLSCARAQRRESYARDGQMEGRMRGPLGGHISEGVCGWSGGWDPPRSRLWLPCSVGSIPPLASKQKT